MRRRFTREWLLPGLLLAFGGAYLGFLFTDFGAIVRGIYLNADNVAGPVIGELYGQAPSSATVILGYHPWYTTLWFELATRHVPFHREVWEVGPWVASVAGIGGVAWATAKAAGRWAGVLVAVVLVCAGSTLLTTQFASDIHGTTAVHVCLLDAFLVLLVTRQGLIGGRWWNLVLCALVAAITAAGLASDSLLGLTGLIPFVVAGLIVAWLLPRAIGRRIALTVVGIGVASLVGSRIAISAMHARHVYTGKHATNFTAWDQLGAHIQQVAQSLATLFNGDFGGAAVGARSVLAFACALVLAWAAFRAFVAARAWYREVRARLGTRDLDASASSVARAVQLTYWSIAALLPFVGALFSSFATTNAGRYFLSTAYGILSSLQYVCAKEFPQRSSLLPVHA